MGLLVVLFLRLPAPPLALRLVPGDSLGVRVLDRCRILIAFSFWLLAHMTLLAGRMMIHRYPSAAYFNASRAARAMALAAGVERLRTTPGSSTSGSSVDQELRLQLDRLGFAGLVLASVQVQLQLDSAKSAL
jgi:hypothetical protein